MSTSIEGDSILHRDHAFWTDAFHDNFNRTERGGHATEDKSVIVHGRLSSVALTFDYQLMVGSLSLSMVSKPM